jgi:hypothetical protein
MRWYKFDKYGWELIRYMFKWNYFPHLLFIVK